MGWKSTTDITREDAIALIFEYLSKVHYMSNTQIEDLLETLGFGEDSDKPYFGHNFNIINQ
jgi:hypothetical protein